MENDDADQPLIANGENLETRPKDSNRAGGPPTGQRYPATVTGDEKPSQDGQETFRGIRVIDLGSAEFRQAHPSAIGFIPKEYAITQ